MKTGSLLIIAAISLSAGTVLWSTRQKVQRSYLASQSCLVGVEAVKQTANAQFFPSERVHRVEVTVPVNVELDETFTGVELTGDTALFRYLEVMVNGYRKASGSISVKMKPMREHGINKDGNYFSGVRYGGDSLGRKLVEEANITARIGIGTPEHADQRKRTFRFTGCPKITTLLLCIHNIWELEIPCWILDILMSVMVLKPPHL